MYFSEFNENLFQNKYRIKTTRLPVWNYSSDGYYFVTICTKECEHFFGEIKKNIMGLNELGCTVTKYWQEIPLHFPFVKLDEFVVMPNHVHGILAINNLSNNRRDAINRVSTTMNNGGVTGKHNAMGKNELGEIIR